MPNDSSKDAANASDGTDIYKDAVAILNETEVVGESTRLYDTIHGLSNRQNATIPEFDKNDATFVFVTRPMLDLGKDNTNRERRMVELASKSDSSIHKYIKLLLDPSHARLSGDSSALLDKQSPFINVFTNSLETLSGWGDEVIESWISPNGLMKEQWGYADGQNKIYSSFNLDMTFSNIASEPIPKIIDTWSDYIANVRKGNFMPSNRALAGREIDYMSAIYVIVVDEARRIKKIARTIGYPIANPKGMYFNYERKKRKNDEYRNYATRFKCFGAEYNDPILLYEFNKLMTILNPQIRALVEGASSNLIEVQDKFYTATNHSGYPLIDLKYNTLEYVVDKTKFKKK